MSTKVKTQTFTSANEWFSLEFPRVWEVEIVENIPSFFDPLFGKGALQVFSAQLGDLAKMTKEATEFPFLNGQDLEEKMMLFLEQQNASYAKEEIKEIKLGAQHLVAHEYYLEGRFYMVCMLQKNQTFLLVLYNSEGAPEEEEAQTVGQIIKSIEIV